MLLNALPNELKQQILQAAPDVPTLLALTEASKPYHVMYLATKAQCLTEVTLRDLRSRNTDIITPQSLIQVRLRGAEAPDLFLMLLQCVIEHCYRQTQRRQKIHLSPRQCQILRPVTDLIGWTIGWGTDRYRSKESGELRPYAAFSLPSYQRTSRGHEYQFEINRSNKKGKDNPTVSRYYPIAFDPNKFPHARPAGSKPLKLSASCDRCKNSRTHARLTLLHPDPDVALEQEKPYLVSTHGSVG